MSGETDLAAILRSLTVSRRDDVVTMVTLPQPVPLANGILAVITEAEGTTVVATITEAERRGWSVGFVGVWLTIDVHTSLEGVGLTAALSAELASVGIPCNVLAGYFHDHLLVPADRADEAVALIEALAAPN